uniref:IQ calmodulin-binding protein n=1 Tax=Trypanosoma congolense (strain IL3000) TaxID=1068625 RepID=G0UYQ4_TRYCI|nr:conserved hypothetical protein [Trypanosoma congolense IL3000]
MTNSSVAGDEDLVRYRGFNKYDELMFPMLTLYCPPVPPSMLVGRYKPPPKPPYKYQFDIATAGVREHLAQVEIARMWRGVRTRRQLHNRAIRQRVRQMFATKIQCWWRYITARWRAAELAKLKQQWLKAQSDKFLEHRLSAQKTMRTWQRSRFESAVIKVQRVFRWFLSRRDLISFDGTTGEALPFPLEYKKKVYFPWRRQREAALMRVDAERRDSPDEEEEGSAGLLQFRKKAKHPGPPSMEDVKAINDAMREREARLAEALNQPEVHDRREWKVEGLLKQDFDHSAGMIQRFVKYRWDDAKKTTLKITSDYFEKKVRIIQRSFRFYTTLCRLRVRRAGILKAAARLNKRYITDRIAETDKEMIWKRVILDNAALTIQKCWAYYKSRMNAFGVFVDNDTQLTDAKDIPNANTPQRPPYGLINEHIERERILRSAASSRMARELEARAKAREKLSGQRYKPQKIIVVREKNVYIPCELSGSTERKEL